MKSRHPGEDAAFSHANDERGKKRRSHRSPSSGERRWEIGDTVGGERSRHDERPRPGDASESAAIAAISRAPHSAIHREMEIETMGKHNPLAPAGRGLSAAILRPSGGAPAQVAWRRG